MRPFGLFITTLGLRFMVVVLVQPVPGFLGVVLSWSLLIPIAHSHATAGNSTALMEE
jgi:hypothetical protein